MTLYLMGEDKQGVFFTSLGIPFPYSCLYSLNDIIIVNLLKYCMALRRGSINVILLPSSPSPPFAALAIQFAKALPFYSGNGVWFPESLVGIYILVCIDDFNPSFGTFSVENQIENFSDQINFSQN